MATEVLVENRVDDGRNLIVQLAADGFELDVALWIKTRDEGLWHFHIGAPASEVSDIGDVFGRIYACLQRIPHHPMYFFSSIKLIDSSSPLAQEAIAIRDRNPGRIPVKYQGTRLGNLPIEEAYIYPRTIGPMTRNEVLQTIVALMDRAGAMPPSLVTLADGSTLRAVPIGVDLKPPGLVSIAFREEGTNAERIVAADDVVNIQ